MRIGFEQKVITPKLPCMLAGYAKQRTAEVVHDELYVKVVVFEQDEHYYALLAYDLLAVDHLIMDAVKAKCAREVKIDHMFFSAIHTHSGPGGILDSEHGFLRGAKSLFGETDSEYLEYVAVQSVEALKQATLKLQAGSIKIAYGSCEGIGSNRNDQCLAGNSSLWLAEICSDAGNALVANFACHPTVLGADNLAVSADFCGAYAQSMQEKGYAMCLFLNGSCGDISSRFTRVGNDFHEVRRMGELLALSSVSLLKQAMPWQENSISYAPFTAVLAAKKAKSIDEAEALLKQRQQQFQLAKTQSLSVSELRLIENGVEGAMADYLYALHYDGTLTYEITVEMMKVGEEIFIGIPGELFSELSNSYENEHTHFISYLNGYQMYFADTHAYEQQFYEAFSSPFAKAESEKLMMLIDRQIKKWRE